MDEIARLRTALGGDAPGSSDFDLNSDVSPPAGRKLRQAAVLVPVLDLPSGARVLLTKRSSALKNHPGQVAFPGGKRDEGDADLTATALREAQEEVGLDPGRVEVLGTLPPHETVTAFTVTPVVGVVKGDVATVVDPNEVAEAFTVPLSFVTDPEAFRVEGRRWQGHKRLYYTAPYGPYYIWGATARILRGLAERMQ